MAAYEQLTRLPDNTVVLLRRPRTSPPASFELNFAHMAETRGMTVEWFEPEVGDRAQVFNRDFAMVESADFVIAYFSEDALMEGGTGHVVDAAMMRDIQVTAYTIDSRGLCELLGEFNPDVYTRPAHGRRGTDVDLIFRGSGDAT